MKYDQASWDALPMAERDAERERMRLEIAKVMSKIPWPEQQRVGLMMKRMSKLKRG